MESTKREAPQLTDENKRTKKVCEDQRVVLNPADCDTDFDIERNGLQGSALYENGFAYCWSGARANVGITGGKYCFGCRIVLPQIVDHMEEDTPPDQRNVCRIGISKGDDNVGDLGETPRSFGFGGTGKFSNAGKFFDYGEKFGVGDTIVCAVNLESKPAASICFSKNGKLFGIARQFTMWDTPNRMLDWASAFFPHVLLKNVVVEVQFSPEDGLIPVEGYKPWSSALGDGNAVMGPTLSNPSQCEVLMMVGLPASGKSTWAEKRIGEHPEKRYILLGTNLVLDRMKVPGLLRKQNYGERFDKLMSRATDIFNTLLPRAGKIPRNYIIDQTNVYKGARKRKLKHFADHRKVAVVAFPTPEELKSRAIKRSKEMGKDVPIEAVNDMLANYILPKSKDIPGVDECFDEVIYTELNRGEAQKYLDEMKRALSFGANVSSAGVSPHLRASSVQSYVSALPSAPTSPGYSSTCSVSQGNYQRSFLPPPTCPPPLNYNYQRPDQVNSAYIGGAVPQVSQSAHLLSAPHVSVAYSGYRHGGYGAYGTYPSPVAEPYPRPQLDMHAYGRSTYAPSPLTSHGPSYAATQTPTYGNPPAYHASANPTYGNPPAYHASANSTYGNPPVYQQANTVYYPPQQGYY